jgi:hypothetical protein
MRIFAQKPKATQRTRSVESPVPGRGHFGQIPEVRSILHLQRTTGNQAMRRTLQTDAGRPEPGLAKPPSARFGHDFGRIPIQPPAAGAIQTKLAINQPGPDRLEPRSAGVAPVSSLLCPIQAKLDIGAVDNPLELEADRVAEQVTSMPTAENFPAVAPLQISHKCAARKEADNEPQKTPAGSPGAAACDAPASVERVLRSPGQPLDAATRAFFEPRFGHDFSRVRIHINSAANQSARALNANAYTVGDSIVFSAGRFVPETRDGRRLIGHELTHVVQQSVGLDMHVQRAPAGASKPTPFTHRIVVIDATIIGEISRGNADAARALRNLVDSAQVYIPLKQYREMTAQPGMLIAGVGPDLPRTAAANKQLISDLRISIAPQGDPAKSTEVLEANKQAGNTISAEDIEVAAAAKANDMEMWSLDKSFVRQNPIALEKVLGIKIAAETHSVHPLDSYPRPDYRRARALLGLTPLNVSVGGVVSGEIETKSPSGKTSAAGGGRGAPGGGAAPAAGRAAPASGPASASGSTARNAALEIIEKDASLKNLEFAAKTLRWFLEVKNFVDTLETIAKSINMAAETLAYTSPYYKEIEEANNFAKRAKELEDSYSAIDLKGQLPRKGDSELDGWSGLQQVQITWYLTEMKLTDSMDSVKAGREHVQKQIEGLQNALKEKEESLVMTPTSLPWADVYLFGDAARQIGSSLLEADKSLQSAGNAVELQRGFARVGIKIMEIRLRELGVTGLVDLDIDTEDLKHAELSKFTMRH